jgi:hypothetical protein
MIPDPRQQDRADPEWNPTHTLDRQIAAARREMGPERWAELQKEWEG